MLWVQVGSALLFCAVALGAFGAHALRGVLDEPARRLYETAVFYQCVHSLGLVLVGILTVLKSETGLLRLSAWCLLVGVVLFSGSLYALSLTSIKRFGMITPLGGVAFLVAWLSLVFGIKS
jgi:uncharacterized membrane protein YgdD (TMEM256/DUF423 family)